MKLKDKTEVIAEIERQISAIDNCPKLTGTQIAVLEGNKVVLTKLLSFLDTLKVKEVDLEEELDNFIKQQKAYIKDDRVVEYDNGDSFNHIYDLEDIAKHFFELGLKAKGAEGICKISKTNSPNFDEAQGTSFVK